MKKTIALLLVSTAIGLPAAAADGAAKKTADARYAEDKKLCAEEADAKSRMQCLRDAKAEHDRAVAAAKAAPAPAASAKSCEGCGKVVSVKVVEKEGEGSALGLIAGGVAGAVLGHQVGGGRGKDLATIAGAAGGAYAGNKIEKNMKKTKVWEVAVHFDDGQQKTYSYASDPGLASGDAVRTSGEGVVRR